MEDKIVALIDVDCFYCQVETRLNSSLIGKPIAVVQYNSWKGGGIIAVNYEARNLGITRHMRGEDARKLCPTIELISVPDIRGKADLSKYRNASREIVAVLCEFCSCVEKASIDEAYLDLTDVVQRKTGEVVSNNKLKSTYVVGYSPDSDGTEQWLSDVYTSGTSKNICNLASAALLVEEIRAAILCKTGFQCSAGISYNKILAKLACGLHKPKGQTVLPFSSVPVLFEKLPLKKIRNLGGKFGETVKNQLNITTVGEISNFRLQDLQQLFGEKSGRWLHNIAQGIDSESVKLRTISKSLGCCKNFKGPTVLTKKTDVEHWIRELCTEIYERIQDDFYMNKRKATLLTVKARQETGNSNAFSKSTPINSYDLEEIIKKSFKLLNKFNKATSPASWYPPLDFIGLSMSKFVTVTDPKKSVFNFFKPIHSVQSTEKEIFKTAVRSPKNSTDNETMDLVHISTDDCHGVEFESYDNNDTVHNNFQNVIFADPKSLNYTFSFFCKYFKNRKIFNFFESNFKNIANAYDYINTEKEHSVVSNKEMKLETTFAKELNLSLDFENSNITPEQEYNNYFYIDDTTSDISENKLHKLNNHNIEMKNLATKYCELCDRQIMLKCFLEHLDYHVACKLNEELNNDTNFENNKIYFSDNISVLGKKRAENRANLIKKNQDIALFFKIKQE